MFTTVCSAAVYGLQAYLVRVEVDLAGGLPSFQLVGSLGSEVKESRERVSVAMKNSGFQIPPAHITVNLAPAGRRKDGTAFDLPIAVGLLRDMELVPEKALQDTLFLGELGLNGEIKKVKGVLPIVQEAAKSGIRRVVVPGENAMEAAVIPGITVWGVNCLNDLLAALKAAGGELPACSCTEKCAPGAIHTDCEACAVNMTECAGTAPEPAPVTEPAEEPEPEPQQKSNTGTLLLILAVAVLGGGAGWYFKIYRPKHEKAAVPEEDYSEELADYDDPEDDGPPWDEDDTESEDNE